MCSLPIICPRPPPLAKLKASDHTLPPSVEFGEAFAGMEIERLREVFRTKFAFSRIVINAIVRTRLLFTFVPAIGRLEWKSDLERICGHDGRLL